MDGAEFDAVTQRLAGIVSRRRSLGVLAGLGLGASLAVGETDAKKKHKKKKKKTFTGPQCPTCPACQTCVNGACQATADGTPCGNNGFCIHGGCSARCGPPDYECPFEFSGCAAPDHPGDSGTCIQIPALPCSARACATTADCPLGSACVPFAGCGLPDDAARRACATILG